MLSETVMISHPSTFYGQSERRHVVQVRYVSNGAFGYRWSPHVAHRCTEKNEAFYFKSNPVRVCPYISNMLLKCPCSNTLYPGLQDHDLVTVYPSVKGMAKDVFFFTHNHRERGGEDDSASKYNVFEVDI
jgi:hypothetical protein